MRIRIRPSARGTSFQGVEGHIVGEVDGEWLVQLDGETRPMRFAKAMVEAVDSPVRWCEPCPDTERAAGAVDLRTYEGQIAFMKRAFPEDAIKAHGRRMEEPHPLLLSLAKADADTLPAPGYCPDDVPGGSAE
jgi:hypothetical protein